MNHISAERLEIAEGLKVCGCISLIYVCESCSYKVLKHSGLTLIGLICHINKIYSLKRTVRENTKVYKHMIKQ